jgi:hypothetical protein
MRQMMMCIHYMSNYYLYDFFKLYIIKIWRKVMGQMMMYISCM